MILWPPVGRQIANADASDSMQMAYHCHTSPPIGDAASYESRATGTISNSPCCPPRFSARSQFALAFPPVGGRNAILGLGLAEDRGEHARRERDQDEEIRVGNDRVKQRIE